ncbi:metallophosphoesterase family protein [Roseovarius salinarum]|uniref:metallophosphoesterase family protein n=1 Tax=Roseovarius salinarum TaxID=1981892 RepID=UPI000C32C77F|nr:metallophosphoesterase family protein [Roseovarius salinarum]
MADPVYVVPDIHGQKAGLDAALEMIAADGGAGARTVFLGDLVDRGPDSRGVVQTLLDGLSAGRDWIVLRGNHDQIFIDVLDAAETGLGPEGVALGWLSGNMGGAATLACYGLEPAQALDDPAALLRAVPTAHREFLRALRWHHAEGDLLFVHAGIRPGVPLGRQDPDDLIWIREPFLSDRRDHGPLIVHGHTPIEFPTHYGNRVDLDAGAGWGRPLIPAVFEGRDAWMLTETGRAPLVPAV